MDCPAHDAEDLEFADTSLEYLAERFSFDEIDVRRKLYVAKELLYKSTDEFCKKLHAFSVKQLEADPRFSKSLKYSKKAVVRVRGLAKRPELNGLAGRVTKCVKASGRYGVEVLDPKSAKKTEFALMEENFEVSFEQFEG